MHCAGEAPRTARPVPYCWHFRQPSRMAPVAAWTPSDHPDPRMLDGWCVTASLLCRSTSAAVTSPQQASQLQQLRQQLEQHVADVWQFAAAGEVQIL
jgi:hypothetical protein